jgi:tRNA(Ile2) C34 agmatinyltransferase TiaS
MEKKKTIIIPCANCGKDIEVSSLKEWYCKNCKKHRTDTNKKKEYVQRKYPVKIQRPILQKGVEKGLLVVVEIK